MKYLNKLTLPRLVLIIALVLGTFFRFWNFRGTLEFLGDQGRDALVVYHIIHDHHPVLIGPVTSTGNMYLGPLYYYMMIPFFLLSFPSPLGPAYAIAALSVITIYLIYRLGKELVGETAAVIAAVCFAFSATVVGFARFSWNPNPAPFFSIILLWASYKFWTKNPWYLVLMSGCIAVLIQLHYVTLLTIPAAGLIWLICLIRLFKKVAPKTYAPLQFALATSTAIFLFLISLTPLALFDLRHDFLNLHSFEAFMTQSDGGIVQTNSFMKMWHIVMETHGRSLHVLFEMFIGKDRNVNTFLTVVVVGTFLFLLFQAQRHSKKKQPPRIGELIIFIYFVMGIIGLSFYQSTVFNHYVAYLYPVTFLMYGVVIASFARHPLGKIAGAAFLLGFLYWNLTMLPLKTLGWTIDDMQRTSQTILARVKPGEKYNIVLMTGTGDIEGQNYRYFLDTSPTPTLSKEHWGETETLFIINEDRKLKKVTDSPIYEIVVFPNKNPAEVYTIPGGPEITVLRKAE